MVEAVRNAEKGLGKVDYTPTEKQVNGRIFSRSLYFVEAIKCGDKITKENVRSVRPGMGMHPKHLKGIIGKTVNEDVEKGDRVNWELINE